jgi:hypothetical protein
MRGHAELSYQVAAYRAETTFETVAHYGTASSDRCGSG